jgi:uncharacterized membrane protein
VSEAEDLPAPASGVTETTPPEGLAAPSPSPSPISASPEPVVASPEPVVASPPSAAPSPEPLAATTPSEQVPLPRLPAAAPVPPTDRQVPGPPPDGLPPLTLAARGLGMLFAEGISVGFAVWTVRAGARLVQYAAANDLGPRGRTFVLGDMFGTGLLACFAAVIYLFLKRRSFAAAARRISDIGWRLAPLAMVGFLPLLLKWQVWVGRDLNLLMLAAIFGLGLQALARPAFRAPPLGIFGRWADRPRAALGRFFQRHRRLVAGAPLALVLAGAAGYALFFGWVTIVSHHAMRTASLDLGLEENLVWNALHWSRPFFKTSPLGGPTASHFGYHATFISYLLAFIYAIAPRAETMLIVQAVMVGAAAIPLFLYARRHLGGWAACLLAYAYLLYPPVHGANLYDFHYLPIGVFFLWLSLYALDARRPVLTVLAVVLTLLVREDVGAGLAIVGAYLLLTGQRPRAGLVVAAIGAGWFVALKMIIMPRVLNGDSSFLYMYQSLVPSGDNSFGGVLKTALANPTFTLNTLLERDKLVYLLELFTPIAFLALRRPIGLLCCLPGIFFTLLSTGYAPLIQTSFQYTANWTTYLFMAMVGNLVWVSRPRTPGDTDGPARRRAWLVALAAATFVCSYQFGAVLQQNTVRGGFGLYTFGTSPQDRDRRRALLPLLAEVPPRAKIAATEMLVAQVSNRPDAYTMRFGVYDADYLLFALPITGDEQRNALPVLQNGSFGVLDVREPFVLARRGAPTTRNDQILQRMR